MTEQFVKEACAEKSLKDACEIVEAHMRKLCRGCKIEMRFLNDGITLVARPCGAAMIYKEEASLYDALTDKAKP